MMESFIYEESPNGPLVNHIINGKPVLASNWGWGINENGKPYYDSSQASPGQQAYLELGPNGRIAIVAGTP
jgi:hypothetical protein